MVRVLGSPSPRELPVPGDSGLGEDQPDIQACQSPLPHQNNSEHHLTPANIGHFVTDDKEGDDSESVSDTFLPDFSCLAVGSCQPPKSDIQHLKSPPMQLGDQYNQFKAQTVISANKAEAQTVTIASLARNGPPAECCGKLSALLTALAKQNLRLLHSVKQSNLLLNKLEREASSYFEVSAK